MSISVRGIALVMGCLAAIGCGGGNGGGGGGSGGTGGGGAGGGGSGGAGGGSGAGSVVRTLVYHQITGGENGGPDGTKGLSFAHDGSVALFDENIAGNYTPTVINFDGSGKKAIDSMAAGWIAMTAVSGDGSLVAYTTDNLYSSSVASPARATVAAVPGTSYSWARIAHDPTTPSKWRLFFFSDRAWGSPSHEAGVWSAAPDGSGLTELISPAQAMAAIGGSVTPAPKPAARYLDVSGDGTSVVNVWTVSGMDWIVAERGFSAKAIAGPLAYVRAVAVSYDGNTVAFTNDANNQRELWVESWDGTNKRMLAAFPGIESDNWGISDDGRKVASNYRLFNTDGSGAFDLAVNGGSYSGDPPTGIDNFLGTPNGAASRFAYIDYGTHRMATLEIDPASGGAAPTLSQPAVSPASVPVDGTRAATLSVKATASGTIARVGATVMLAGTHDNVFNDVVLLDDGTHGDATAGDGIYTNNQIQPDPGAGTVMPGARTIRIRATFVDGGGKSHSTAIDVSGLGVQ